MNDERRTNSLETVMVSLGRLEEKSEHIHSTVCSLNERVGIQNGKVGKLQEQYSFVRGVVAILLLTIIPITINFVSSWLKFTFHI